MEKKLDREFWESFFQSLQMTYYGLLAGPLFLFAIVFLRAENRNSKLLQLSPETSDQVTTFIVIFTLVLVVGLHFAIKKLYKQAAVQQDILEKMLKYRKATLTKYITLAVLQVLVVLAFGATYHNGLMGLFTALLLYSSFFRPELKNVKRDLRMSKNDFEKIDYKGGLIS